MTINFTKIIISTFYFIIITACLGIIIISLLGLLRVKTNVRFTVSQGLSLTPEEKICIESGRWNIIDDDSIDVLTIENRVSEKIEESYYLDVYTAFGIKTVAMKISCRNNSLEPYYENAEFLWRLF